MSALKPDRQDALLLLLLAQWSSLLGLPLSLGSRGAAASSGNFEPRHLSERPEMLSQVCEYFETIGMLYSYGLLNEDLLFRWIPVSPIWDEAKEYVLHQREKLSVPQLWAEFEALAVAQKRLNREYST